MFVYICLFCNKHKIYCFLNIIKISTGWFGSQFITLKPRLPWNPYGKNTSGTRPLKKWAGTVALYCSGVLHPHWWKNVCVTFIYETQIMKTIRFWYLFKKNGCFWIIPYGTSDTKMNKMLFLCANITRLIYTIGYIFAFLSVYIHFIFLCVLLILTPNKQHYLE